MKKKGLRTLEPILEKLAGAREALMRAADEVPAGQWRIRPGDGEWSAAELVAHLIMVERSVVTAADKVLHKPPRHVPIFKRFHLPLILVEKRVVRRKTPLSLDAGLLREKEAMLGELRCVRERSLAFLDETRTRDLRAYRWRHAFLGSFNLYGWFSFIASHERRHEKQMREISARLPKAVASLQK